MPKVVKWRMTMTKAVMKSTIYGVVVTMAMLMGDIALRAATVVETLGGGPIDNVSVWAGNSDGNTKTDTQFNTPCGIAVDISGTLLYVADRDNNAIRIINLTSGKTEHFAISDTSLINKPIGVAVDSDYNVFVLNYGNGSNGSIYEFDSFGDTIATNAVNLANVGGITLDSADNIYLTVNNNQLKRITGTNTTTIATIAASGTSLKGLVLKRAGATAGLIAVCDAGNNGIYLIDPTSGVVTTNAGFHGVGDFSPTGTDAASKTTARFNQPTSLAEASDGSLIVADYGNNRVKIINASDGSVYNLYGVPASYWVVPADYVHGVYPGWYDGTVDDPDVYGGVEARQTYGVVLSPDGTVYVTENYYDIIRKVTGSGLVPPPLPPTIPSGLSATVNLGQITLKWNTNSTATSYNVKRSTTNSGPYTIVANNVSGTSYIDTGVANGTTYYYVVSSVSSGVESGNSSELIVTVPTLLPPTGLSATTNYNLVKLTWSASSGAASYNIKRSTSTNTETTIANVTVTTYSDTNVLNGTTYYYVVSAVNYGGESTNSTEINATPPLPPVSSPQIGYVTFPPPNYTSVFVPVSSSGVTFNNDTPIVIEGAAGSQTFYTYLDTPFVTNVPDPTASSASAPSGYVDGLTATNVGAYTLQQPVPAVLPNFAIKAIGEQSGHPNSAIVSALFQFVVGNPLVIGTNAARFNVSSITVGAQMYYTTDGSIPNPTNASAVGPITNGAPLSLSIPNGTNLIFKVAGFKANYQDSAIVTNVFYKSNFLANTISFGFASGEASSAFVAAPGQIFYAPVTLSPLPGTIIYSLQFNLTVTNVTPAPAGSYYSYNVPFVTPFQSMLVQPNPTNADLFMTIPPAMFDAGSGGLVSLLNINNSENLLAVGWIERYGQTNLYNTKSQDLIAHSIAHDTLFEQGNGKVILGGYAVTIPADAVPGQTYQIQIGRPSATDDGIGAPGSSVYIEAPTNGSLNALKNVTVGSQSYIAGDSAPFRWFNAGDFGNTNLDNVDVEQVFQSAMYSLNYPPLGSDFFDSMDSAGGFGADYGGYGYLQRGPPVASEAGYGNDDDTTVNFSVFGDGVLDVSDVYTTFRRSLDPSLTWYRRFWTNDTVNGYSGLAAVVVSNVFNPSALAKSLAQSASSPISITNTPSVNFASTDFVASAGQVLQVPITANVFGAYPLRVAMFNISVVPLDGSPPLTVPVSFTANSTNTALGAPTSGFTISDGNNNYGAAWLNNKITGISNSAVIGTLTVTIPTNATSMSSYAIHFDHASGSPNGAVSFPRKAFTGLITLSSRTNSTYGDGIPDSWRLRWFGTVNNYLSVSNADADGSGMNNWQKYVAGLDPTDPKSKLTAGTDQPMAQGPQDSVIYWPSVQGKQYVIQRSASLFPGTWSSISTNTGTGGYMEIHDPSGGNARFYRVSVQ